MKRLNVLPYFVPYIPIINRTATSSCLWLNVTNLLWFMDSLISKLVLVYGFTGSRIAVEPCLVVRNRPELGYETTPDGCRGGSRFVKGIQTLIKKAIN